MKKNVVFTAFYNGVEDWQRHKKWDAEYSQLSPLINSLSGDTHLVIFHDCFDNPIDTDKVTHIKVPPITMAPYLQKWINAYGYMLNHPEIEKCFLVDATDVLMCNCPWDAMQSDKVYLCDEQHTLSLDWMAAVHNEPPLLDFYKAHPDYPLLNAGVFGGYREIAIKFMATINAYYHLNWALLGAGHSFRFDCDMGLVNYVARIFFADDVVHGREVTTVFKADTNPAETSAWWKHK